MLSSKRWVLRVIIAVSLSLVTVTLLERIYQDMTAHANIGVRGGNVFDAGHLTEHSRLVHTFHLTNPHPFMVSVAEVTAGCDCTHLTLSRDWIPAHGSIEATVGVDIEQEGKVSAGVCITTKYRRASAQKWLFIIGQTGKVKPL